MRTTEEILKERAPQCLGLLKSFIGPRNPVRLLLESHALLLEENATLKEDLGCARSALDEGQEIIIELKAENARMKEVLEEIRDFASNGKSEYENEDFQWISSLASACLAELEDSP